MRIVFGRNRGPEPLDETAFHRGQQRWGTDRPAGWDNIPDRVLTRLERRGYEPGPPYDNTEPGYMRYQGRIVIDSDNRYIYLCG